MPIINQKIRVLVVDDSMVARSMITQGPHLWACTQQSFQDGIR